MDNPDQRETTTVAFELAALERVLNPAAAFDQTTGWARAVGLVSDRPIHVVTHKAREWGIDYSFTSGPRDMLDSLVAIRGQPEHEADRYLLIGRGDSNPEQIRQRGWAYLPIDEAAIAAGWTLRESNRSDSSDEPESRDWP